MKSIRKIGYAAFLALTTVSATPSLLADENVHGSFALRHDVRWQNAFVPAGRYRFSYEHNGVGGVLVLRRVSGASAAYILLVHEVGPTGPAEASRLVLHTTTDGSYLSTMQLSQAGVTLHF